MQSFLNLHSRNNPWESQYRSELCMEHFTLYVEQLIKIYAWLIIKSFSQTSTSIETLEIHVRSRTIPHLQNPSLPLLPTSWGQPKAPDPLPNVPSEMDCLQRSRVLCKLLIRLGTESWSCGPQIWEPQTTASYPAPANTNAKGVWTFQLRTFALSPSAMMHPPQATDKTLWMNEQVTFLICYNKQYRCYLERG